MRVGVGVSTGSEVVCAALVTIDSDGSHAVEYRTVSADRQANTDVGELVMSAIELMASLVPGHSGPDAIAVTYRTDEHASTIRAALANTARDVLLVPETAAALEHLAGTGLVDRYSTVALVDLGASGMTVNVVDRADHSVLAHSRSDEISGDILNRLVKDLVQDMTRDDLRDDIRDHRGTGSARYRSIKERLSSDDGVRIDRFSGVPLTIDRDRFDSAAAPVFEDAAQFVETVSGASGHAPESIVLIGGGAHIPLLADTFARAFDVPVIRLPEPDAVLAVGAAQVAASAASAAGTDYPIVSASRHRAGGLSRYTGALAAAVVAGGLVLAYGVQTLTPADDSSVSPAGGTTQPAAAGPSDPTRTIGSGSGGTDDASMPARTSISDSGSAAASSDAPWQYGYPSTSVQTSTPILRPGPDLPSIEWPAESTQYPSQSGNATELSADPPSLRTTTPVLPFEPTEPSEPGSTPRPAEGADPEVTVVPTESISVPTTEVSDPESTPVLTPPPTVWSPPSAELTAPSTEGTAPGAEVAAPGVTTSATPAATPDP